MQHTLMPLCIRSAWSPCYFITSLQDDCSRCWKEDCLAYPLMEITNQILHSWLGHLQLSESWWAILFSSSLIRSAVQNIVSSCSYCAYWELSCRVMPYQHYKAPLAETSTLWIHEGAGQPCLPEGLQSLRLSSGRFMKVRTEVTGRLDKSLKSFLNQLRHLELAFQAPNQHPVSLLPL